MFLIVKISTCNNNILHRIIKLNPSYVFVLLCKIFQIHVNPKQFKKINLKDFYATLEIC